MLGEWSHILGFGKTILEFIAAILTILSAIFTLYIGYLGWKERTSAPNRRRQESNTTPSTRGPTRRPKAEYEVSSIEKIAGAAERQTPRQPPPLPKWLTSKKQTTEPTVGPPFPESPQERKRRLTARYDEIVARTVARNTASLPARKIATSSGAYPRIYEKTSERRYAYRPFLFVIGLIGAITVGGYAGSEIAARIINWSGFSDRWDIGLALFTILGVCIGIASFVALVNSLTSSDGPSAPTDYDKPENTTRGTPTSQSQSMSPLVRGWRLWVGVAVSGGAIAALAIILVVKGLSAGLKPEELLLIGLVMMIPVLGIVELFPDSAVTDRIAEGLAILFIVGLMSLVTLCENRSRPELRGGTVKDQDGYRRAS